jgi:hypothetical protein
VQKWLAVDRSERARFASWSFRKPPTVRQGAVAGIAPMVVGRVVREEEGPEDQPKTCFLCLGRRSCSIGQVCLLSIRNCPSIIQGKAT